MERERARRAEGRRRGKKEGEGKKKKETKKRREIVGLKRKGERARGRAKQ